MGRAINFIYGAILLWLAVEALWLDIIPDEFLPYAVLLMGVVILFTKIDTNRLPASYAPHPRSFFDYIRRYLFGAALILMGLASSIGAVGDFAPLLAIGTQSGSLILAAIAAIYFLSAFARTRTMQISSI